MHKTQFSQINSPAISLLVYQNNPLKDKLDIQFVHYNKNMNFDNQILSSSEQFDNISKDGADNDKQTELTTNIVNFCKAILHLKNYLKKENLLLDEINSLNQNCDYLIAKLKR
ncbi:9970_t:CDS:2 [Gigaspora margarita]|uniref:9970_t:CDS:1 n=1 Tax=Gigaspora margarita TaxID=4874 RepID=A0ABM8VYX2_GIGMA|nr:9970_t:CDS:2 [Gigaspora margarita]